MAVTCEHVGPVWFNTCDACVVRKIREMPDRARRGQVLEAVRMRRGQGTMDRIRKLVEETWNDREA